MPQVTLYIRKEDMDLWRALDNKAGVISDMLNNRVATPKIVTAEKNNTPINRATFDVLKDIERVKAEYADKLEYCQDFDTRTDIERELQDTLDALWGEYNQLKAEL